MLGAGPLRTGRDGFPSSGSSTSNASVGRRGRDAKLTAFTIRTWSRRALRRMACQSMAYDPPLRLRPHRQLAPSSSALSHMPICPVLSCEAPQGSLLAFAPGDFVHVAEQPVSAPLQSSLRFLPDLLSSPPSVPLTRYLPSYCGGGGMDLPCSVEVTRWVRPCTPAALFTHDGGRMSHRTHCIEPRSILGSSYITTLTGVCVF